ncbi:MAG: YdgA family protein [Legionellaceae bacterium]|nr:YdgA family protein [Legionellaceae bacterium]
MKKLLGITVLLIVVLLGAYFSTGLITERTLKKNLKTLNQANGLAVDLVGYHRGLFKSTADVTWRMQLPEKVVKNDDGHSLVVPPKTYTFDMPLTVYHGPILIKNNRVRFGLGAARGELSLPDAYASEFSDMFSEQSTKPILGINLFVTYLNKTHLEVDLPAFQLLTKQGKNQFEWLGMNSDLRFSPEGSRLQGHFALDGLRLVGQKFRVILNKVSSAYDVHKAKNGLFLGEASLNLPVLQVADKQQTEFALKQLELNSKSILKEDLFDSSFSAAFATLVSRDKTYGPAKFEVAIKKLDANVLAELNQRINQLQQADTMGGQTQQLLLSLLPDLPKLLGKGAIFEVSTLKMGLPEGAIDGSIQIVFPLQSEKMSPLQVLPKISGEGHLNVPAPFLKSLLVRSFKQQLIRAHEETSTKKQDNQQGPDKKPLSPSILNAETKDADEQNNTAAPVTLAEIDQQAVHHADQKLADLMQMGALQAKGADYVLELKLSSGRLLVNGHPFHSGMLSF